MKTVHILKYRRTLSLLGLALGLLSAYPAMAQNRFWNKGTTETAFNTGANYSPTGTIQGSDVLIFDTATSPSLTLSASQAMEGIEIRSGAGTFYLKGSAYSLNVKNTGVVVGSGVTATLEGGVSAHTSATSLVFDVGSGASLTVGGMISATTRPVIKKGSGTLILENGAGLRGENYLRNGAVIRFEEGTVVLGDNAHFQPGTSFTTGTLIVNLGTASSAAALMGGGSLAGASDGQPVEVRTFGSAQSFIAPSGDGTLEIQNLNASAGSTFRFELGNALIFGSGTMTGGSDLVFEFSGGEAGQRYTLFEYGTLSNVIEDSFTIASEGYVVDFWDISDGRVQVQFAAVPEPSAVGLGLAACLAVALGCRGRKGVARV